MLEIKSLSVRYRELTIVDAVSFSVAENEWLMIVGPNGAGKSTLISAISQCAPYTGTVLYLGTDIARMKPSTLAQNIGVLTQSHSISYGFSVEDIVRLGRYCHSHGVLSSSDSDADKMVESALEMTGIKSLRTHSALTLSGGELQRTFLAQLFAQNPNLLILDEPTNHLDLMYQKQTFELIEQWRKNPGHAVISVMHDLSVARTYGTNALLMDKGKIIGCGKTADVLSRENLQSVYSIDVFDWMNKFLSHWEV
ncbi:MAG: ABC transporter ATP-binding protein [Oscillospiraceae bacterium]